VRANSAAAIMPRLPRSPNRGDQDADGVLRGRRPSGFSSASASTYLSFTFRRFLNPPWKERLVDALVRVFVLDVFPDEVKGASSFGFERARRDSCPRSMCARSAAG
jgi:hypothetical protein